MSNLELVALVVRDYDAAIHFFVDVLQFKLVEDTPSLTNDGRPKRWVVCDPVEAKRLSSLHALTAMPKPASSASSSLVASGCSSAWTTSRSPISAWLQRACDSSRRLATNRTGRWRCSSTWKATAGIS